MACKNDPVDPVISDACGGGQPIVVPVAYS